MEWLLPNDTVNPLFFKAGFVLSVTASGYIFSQIRSRQTAYSAASRPRHLVFGPGRTRSKVSVPASGGLKEELALIEEEDELNRLKREIVGLKNLVRSLQEEEKILKAELAEYCGVLDHVPSVGSNRETRISGEAWEVAELGLKLKELGDKTVELRKENSRLAQANLDLMKKTEEESTKIEDCNSSNKLKFLTMLKKIVPRKVTHGSGRFSFSASSSSSSSSPPTTTTAGVALPNKTNPKSPGSKLKRRASFDNGRSDLNSQNARCARDLGCSRRRFSFRI